MQITRTCPITKVRKTRELDVTADQISRWQSGKLIQDVMPQLNAEEREFILSGIDGAVWERHVESGDDE